MRLLRTAILAVLILGSPARSARAADPEGTRAPAVANPHGDLKTECEACHTAKSWKRMRSPLLFHHEKTGFPLNGRHVQTKCGACHASLEFARVSTACADCHRDVHEGRAGIRCQDCHTASSWSQRSKALAEHGRTGFTLRGLHALVECARCHIGSGEATFEPVSRECYSCHASAYASAQAPNHVVAGYSTQCEGCHDPTKARWGGAGFNHALTGFALTGAHTLTACESCHGGGTYAGTPRDCYACHATDYAATTNPIHSASGFSTACAGCHSTTAWRPADFNHDQAFFRIYSGRHRDLWTACAQCHENTASYADFTCLSCHQHNQADMDAKHAGRSGYTYDSAACYRCHRSV